MEIRDKYGGPQTVPKWHNDLLKETTESLSPVDEKILAALNDPDLREELVKCVVARWIKEQFNLRLRRAIRTKLEQQPQLTSLCIPLSLEEAGHNQVRITFP